MTYQIFMIIKPNLEYLCRQSLLSVTPILLCQVVLRLGRRGLLISRGLFVSDEPFP